MRLPRLSRWTNSSLAIAWVIALVASAWMLSVRHYTDDLPVYVHWPAALGARVDSKLVVSVTDLHGRRDDGADVELGAVSVPRTRSYPVDFGAYYATDDVIDAVDSADYRVVDEAEADAHGNAVLTLPSADELRRAGVSAGTSDEILLVVRVSDGLNHRIGYMSYPLPAGASAKSSADHTAATSPVKLRLTADRPLYRPGQTIYMRGLLLEAGTNRPLPAASSKAGAAVQYSVKGPRNNVLFREHALVSPAGVSSQSFALADDCPSGTYTLTVQYKDAAASQTVEVRSYEKPAFVVGLRADPVHFGSAASSGSTIHVTGAIDARYFAGNPVVGAKAVVEVDTEDIADDLGTAQGKLDRAGRWHFDVEVPTGLYPDLQPDDLFADITVTDDWGACATFAARLRRCATPTGWRFCPSARANFAPAAPTAAQYGSTTTRAYRRHT